MDRDFPECSRLSGRLKDICEHKVLTPAKCDRYRTKLGIPPLEAMTADYVHEVPSILIRGWNFAHAMTRWTVAGMPRRTQVEIDERLGICQSCEFLQNKYCTKCGCACIETNQIINKLALATEKCPIGKWE